MFVIIILLALFMVSVASAELLAVIVDNFSTFRAGAWPDHLSVDAQTLGECLFFTDLLLCLGLLWWFYRAEPRKRAQTTPATGLGMFFSLRPFRRVMPQPPTPWSIVLLSVCAALLMLLGFDALLEPLHLSDGGTTDHFKDMLQTPLCILTVCIIGPLTEELVFRMGIFRTLCGQYLPVWAAALVSALLFGLVHGNLLQGVGAIFAGIVFALMFVRSGNLKICLPAHIANNTLFVCLLHFNLSDTQLPWYLGLVLLLAGLALFHRILHIPNEDRNTQSA